MEKFKSTVISMLSVIVILGLLIIYDQRKPDCVEAQTCVPIRGAVLEGETYRDTGGSVIIGAVTTASGGTRACFLTSTYTGNRNNSDDLGGCRVTSDGVNWRLSSQAVW